MSNSVFVLQMSFGMAGSASRRLFVVVEGSLTLKLSLVFVRWDINGTQINVSDV